MRAAAGPFSRGLFCHVLDFFASPGFVAADDFGLHLREAVEAAVDLDLVDALPTLSTLVVLATTLLTLSSNGDGALAERVDLTAAGGDPGGTDAGRTGTPQD